MDALKCLEEMVEGFDSAPLLEEMPLNTLEDKGIAGPTAAHRIEQIHTPLNFAYLTCTTGSSAFQNLVGVVPQELPMRTAAGKLALERAGLRRGDSIVVTYPPLVNVFTRQALDEYGITVRFIRRPSRDALLLELCRSSIQGVIGESSFLRATLADARKMGLWTYLPRSLVLLAAGTPLDRELETALSPLPDWRLHDLYGCQEFGWLTLDGVPLRKDIALWDAGRKDRRHYLLVGGLPTGDCFPLDVEGRVLTPDGIRAEREPEVALQATTLADPLTAARVARSILRIKAKIVRLSPELRCSQSCTRLQVAIPGCTEALALYGPDQTKQFDDLVEAQKQYQVQKKDPVWCKTR